MLIRNTLGVFAVAAASMASAVSLVPAASATAAMPAAATYPGYTHVAATSGFGSSYAAGAYVDCPAGKLALASGSAVSDTRGVLLSGSTTTAGTGSFASAQTGGTSGALVEVRSACAPADTLKGFTRASLAVRDHTTGNKSYRKQATCPGGYVAYGGGANVVNSDGYYDVSGLYTHGIVPDGRSWTYSGFGNLNGRTLLVEAKCLPRTRLGRITTVTRTVTGPDIVGGRHPVSVGARCPDGYVAFAGGAFLHPVESTVSTWDGYLRANLMATDDRGWLAVGDTFKPGTQLTVKVRCTDRLG
jgi:hypothetical protein